MLLWLGIRPGFGDSRDNGRENAEQYVTVSSIAKRRYRKYFVALATWLTTSSSSLNGVGETVGRETVPREENCRQRANEYAKRVSN
jgi:hypothetical protein